MNTLYDTIRREFYLIIGRRQVVYATRAPRGRFQVPDEVQYRYGGLTDQQLGDRRATCFTLRRLLHRGLRVGVGHEYRVLAYREDLILLAILVQPLCPTRYVTRGGLRTVLTARDLLVQALRATRANVITRSMYKIVLRRALTRLPSETGRVNNVEVVVITGNASLC